MTLISIYKYKYNPSIFMLGDGMTSTETPAPGYYEAPGKGPITREQSKFGYYPYEHIQKVNILGSDLAFAWSGSLDVATRFADELYEFYHSTSYSKKELKIFLDNWLLKLTDSDFASNAFICVAHFAGLYYPWTHGTKNYDGFKHFEYLQIAGSGEQTFATLFDNDPEKIETEDEALGHSMNILNRFYFNDILHETNAQFSFGGVYELVAFTQKGIKKHSNIYVGATQVDADKVDKIWFPYSLKYDVKDDLCVLRDFQVFPGEGNRIYTKTYTLLPITTKLQKKAIILKNRILSERNFFHSKIIGGWRAKYFLLTLRYADALDHVWLHQFRRIIKDAVPIKMRFQNMRIEITFSKKFLAEVMDKVPKYIDAKKGKLKPSG